MVWLARENLGGAEELLQQDHAGELVGERLWAQRHALVGEVEGVGRQAAWAADQEADVAGIDAALLEPVAPARQIAAE